MWDYIHYLNVFQWCKFLRYLGHVMVLLVLGIVGFSWFTVVACYGPTMVKGPPLSSLGCAMAILWFTAVNAMLLWSYCAAVATCPGMVPPGWHPFEDEQEAAAELHRMSQPDYFFDRRDPRRPRWCKRCEAWKPERSHHCSVSGRCILKMDHWCIWVVNCVGLLNYKAFLLFLFYTFLASLSAVLLLIKPMINFFSQAVPTPGTAFSFITLVMDSAFVAAVGGFLIMHYQLLAANCTTIEMYEKERIQPWPYNHGLQRNMEEVLGKDKWSWLVPTQTKEERKHLLDSCLKPLLQSGSPAPYTSAV